MSVLDVVIYAKVFYINNLVVGFVRWAVCF